ncbi:HigA family addiction module antitoxin [Endozoicomonas sp. 8E]|uniref:HigA family addiction module antitoxin n=1 Tax=Endozoicomonas sp. 8E TaxID=3035692 RepID=UPI002938DFCC|nr:HigA family addiction module antitoxin [Endozoicomonas sp. 8E]WOG28164.1 HigA family addiction module antitoxin [Endozoicomonas sp. 8E]
MAIYNPAHPGEILGEDLLKPLGLSVTQAAEHLRVSRKTLSKIINGRGRLPQKWRCVWKRCLANLLPTTGCGYKTPMTFGSSMFIAVWQNNLLPAES